VLLVPLGSQPQYQRPLQHRALTNQLSCSGVVEGMQRGSAAAPFDGGPLSQTPTPLATCLSSGAKKRLSERDHQNAFFAAKSESKRDPG
jgi:hypothetical protein